MNEKIDCVEMKHNGAMEIQKRLKGKSRAMQLKYWHKKYLEMVSLKKSLSDNKRNSQKDE